MQDNFLKTAAMEPVPLKVLRDWIVKSGGESFPRFCSLPYVDEFPPDQTVMALCREVCSRYLYNVKNAGLSYDEDRIASKICKLADDFVAEDFNTLWGSLDDEQKCLLALGVPERVYNFQKRSDCNIGDVMISALMKCAGQDNLADLYLDELPVFDTLNELLDKLAAKIVVHD